MDIPFDGYNQGGDDRRERLEARRDELLRLPLRDPAEALLECFADALRRLSICEIATLRAELARHSSQDTSFIDVIDGHLILRDLSASS